MASKVFDASELEAYAGNLQKIAKDFPKTEKQFMRKEGQKLKSKTLKQAKTLGRKTGNYLKSIKRGKAYRYEDDTMAIRVYSTSPHAHLIEDGHKMVNHDGTEVGFVPGHHVFEIAGKAFEPQYVTDIDEMLDKEVEKL